MPNETPLLEVAPSGTAFCTVEGCAGVVFSKQLCKTHYFKQNPTEKKGKKSKPEEERTPTVPVTREVVTSFVVCSMQGLATFVDESFNVLDAEMKPLPHVESAITEMMPWMQIYGGVLMKMVPWFGLGAGIVMLSKPSFDPAMEIVAGVRKPRIMRKGSDDIYTDAFKATGFASPAEAIKARTQKKLESATVSEKQPEEKKAA